MGGAYREGVGFTGRGRSFRGGRQGPAAPCPSPLAVTVTGPVPCRHHHGVPVPAGQLGPAGSNGAGVYGPVQPGKAWSGPVPHGAATSLLQFATKVVSCQAAELRPEGGGEPVRGFQVVLEDTILFPEGGGQVRRVWGTGLGSGTRNWDKGPCTGTGILDWDVELG